MKVYRFLPLFTGVLVISPVALATSLTVSFESFLEPSGFSITSGDALNLRVAELTVPEVNQSTHILVESLSPLESGSLVYASSYAGVDIDSGETQDTGVVYMEMSGPMDVPAGSVSSPIVGIVERSGGWSEYSPMVPPSSLGGVSGEGDYSTEGTFVLSLERGGSTFSGSVDYTVVDADTVELDAFSLIQDGVDTIELSGATLVRDGSVYSGTVTNQGASAEYDSLLFTVRLSEGPDADGDGIPDLTDQSMEAGLLLAVGEWNSTDLGLMYGLTENWGWSLDYGFTEVSRAPIFYQPVAGWMHWVGGDSAANWFYGYSHGGWMRVPMGGGGHYEYGVDADGNSSHGDFHDPLVNGGMAGLLIR